MWPSTDACYLCDSVRVNNSKNATGVVPIQLRRLYYDAKSVCQTTVCAVGKCICFSVTRNHELEHPLLCCSRWMGNAIAVQYYTRIFHEYSMNWDITPKYTMIVFNNFNANVRDCRPLPTDTSDDGALYDSSLASSLGFTCVSRTIATRLFLRVVWLPLFWLELCQIRFWRAYDAPHTWRRWVFWTPMKFAWTFPFGPIASREVFEMNLFTFTKLINFANVSFSITVECAMWAHNSHFQSFRESMWWQSCQRVIGHFYCYYIWCIWFIDWKRLD